MCAWMDSCLTHSVPRILSTAIHARSQHNHALYSFKARICTPSLVGPLGGVGSKKLRTHNFCKELLKQVYFVNSLLCGVFHISNKMQLRSLNKTRS